MTLILPVAKKPATPIADVVVTRHAAGHVRAGVGDSEGLADERRGGVSQTERETPVAEVGDARAEDPEEERERQSESWGTCNVAGT